MQERAPKDLGQQYDELIEAGAKLQVSREEFIERNRAKVVKPVPPAPAEISLENARRKVAEAVETIEQSGPQAA